MPRNMLNGALIVMCMRWTDRLIGAASTLILARLLVPEDFGVVAMASIYAGVIDTFLDLGVNTTLVHKRDCDDEDYGTAWTIRIIQTSLAALVIVASSTWVAEYYSDLRITTILWVMALTTLVSGLENIGIVTFQKEMEFGKDFQFFFYRRVAGFAVTLIIASAFRTYWALPLGALAGRLAGVALSYTLHPLRPRLSLSRARGMWSLSQWILLKSIGGYLDSRIDKLIIGHRTNATTLGHYALADEISAMPSSELLAPLGRVLFPAFVNLRGSPQRLRQAFGLALSVQITVVLPTATGLALVAREAVTVLLGEAWGDAVPFVQVLALVYGASSISHAAGYLLMTVGRMRPIAICVWLQLAAFATGVFTFLSDGTPFALAQWRLVVSIAGSGCVLVLVAKLVDGMRARDIISNMWRPATANGIMAAALLGCPKLEPQGVAELAMRCVLGAAIYSCALLALWTLSKRPYGCESYVLETFRRFRSTHTR